jgi:O-antigen ligase
MPQSPGEPSLGIEDVLAPPSEILRVGKRLHPFEVTLVALVLIELCVLPWAFGGVDPSTQLFCAAVSACALALALLPRRSMGVSVDGSHRIHRMWPRLSAFPVFWAGLAILGYVAVQSFNPSYTYRLKGTTWWLDPRAHVAWLPSGMDTPFGETNGWRVIATWGSVWALVCALWVGITRRTSILAILVALEVNAFAFAIFGIIQRASGAAMIYGERDVGHNDFLAAIIYRNHAAAYFSILAAVSLGLTIRAFWKARSHQDPSGPGIIQLLLSLALIVALVLSGSFAAIGLFAALLAVLLPAASWRYSTAFRGPGGDAPVFITAAFLVVLMCGLCIFVGYGTLRERVETFENGGGQKAARIRLLMDERGLEMFRDRWVLGWGAGSFRYGFSKYQKREPGLSRIEGAPVRWEHAHNDWLETLIEMGALGSIPLVCASAYWIRKLIQLRLWRKLSAFPMLMGLALLAVHSLVDFPLQNLAVLATASALLPLLVRWAELDGEAT